MSVLTAGAPPRPGRMPIESLVPRGMRIYGELCGWTLARAHARSGGRIAIAANLGGSDRPGTCFPSWT